MGAGMSSEDDDVSAEKPAWWPWWWTTAYRTDKEGNVVLRSIFETPDIYKLALQRQRWEQAEQARKWTCPGSVDSRPFGEAVFLLGAECPQHQGPTETRSAPAI